MIAALFASKELLTEMTAQIARFSAHSPTFLA